MSPFSMAYFVALFEVMRRHTASGKKGQNELQFSPFQFSDLSVSVSVLVSVSLTVDIFVQWHYTIVQ